MAGFGKKLKRLFSKKRGHLEEVWHVRLDAQLLGGLIVSDLDGTGNKVLFGSKKGELFCVNLHGKTEWTFSIQVTMSEQESLFHDPETMNSIVAEPLAVDINNDGKKEILFGSEMGVLYCLNAQGKLLWSFKAGDALRGGITAGSLTEGNAKEVVFGCMDRYLYVVTAEGKLLWKIKAKAPIESTPRILADHNQIVFGTNDGTVYSVSLRGELLWGFKTKAKITAQPVLAELERESPPVILLGSYDGNLYAFSTQGHLEWRFASEGPIVSSVTVADPNQDGKQEIFFGSSDNKVYAVNYQGDKLWEYETTFWVVASPCVADLDHNGYLEVIAGSYDTTVYVLDAKGSYELEYVPGLSGVVHQAGHYTDIMTQAPGKLQGKKLLEYASRGVIVGLVCDPASGLLIVADKTGEVQALAYKEEE